MDLQKAYERAYVDAERRIDLLTLIDRLQLMLFTFKPKDWEADIQTLFDIKKVLGLVDAYQKGYVDAMRYDADKSSPLYIHPTKCKNIFLDMVNRGGEAE